MVGGFPPQGLGDPVTCPFLPSGGHPQSDGSLPPLTEDEESCKADRRHPEYGEQAVTHPLAESHRPNH
jgi:hypothetical protein